MNLFRTVWTQFFLVLTLHFCFQHYSWTFSLFFNRVISQETLPVCLTFLSYLKHYKIYKMFFTFVYSLFNIPIGQMFCLALMHYLMRYNAYRWVTYPAPHISLVTGIVIWSITCNLKKTPKFLEAHKM